MLLNTELTLAILDKDVCVDNSLTILPKDTIFIYLKGGEGWDGVRVVSFGRFEKESNFRDSVLLTLFPLCS